MRIAEDTKLSDMPVQSHTRANLVVGIPSLGMVPIEFVVAFARLQMPVNALCYSVFTKGMEVGVARNYIADQALSVKPEARYLFFLGDDMIPPWDGLIRLQEEMEIGGWDVLSGLYYMKQEPPVPIAWRKDHIGRLVPGVHYKVGEVVWVDVTGLDFTLIRLSIFNKLSRPWFKTGPTYVGNGNIVSHTEDVWFLDKVREQGFRVGVHTGVRVAHFDHRTGVIY